jgi:hypothetical protein
MNFAWPEYIECLWTVHNAFLGPIASDIISSLRSSRVVEIECTDTSRSTSKQWRRPHRSLIVGSAFRDAEGNLLIDDVPLAKKVVASGYSAKSMQVLRKLGARDLTFSDFLESLEYFIRHKARSYKRSDSDWHSTIADVLLSHFRKNTYGRYAREFSRCKNLRLVPLRDGEWVSAASKSTFLVGNRRQQIPRGLTVRFVDNDAAADPSRNELFQLLGVKSCNQAQVCKLILDNHAQELSNQRVPDLISQAVFLFRAGYRPQPDARIMVVDSAFCPRYRVKVHVPFGDRGAKIRRLFAPNFKEIHWLHQDYENAVEEDDKQEWVQWLIQWINIDLWPPMVENGQLSPYMRHVLERNGSKKFLSHLKARTSDEDPLLGLYRWATEAVTQEIATLLVSTDTGTHQLCETVLPALRMASSGYLPVLELHQPNDTAWTFLQEYGVLITPCLELYLRQLESLKARGDLTLLDAVLPEVYRNVQSYAEQRREIR